jgi:hypothetical protein
MVAFLKMKEQLDIFLLIGQSNMAGRGRLDEVEVLRDPRILVFRQGQWMTAAEPLHTDKAEAGIGIGMSFAVEVLRSRGVSIGLVPCAVGGTPLSRWMPGEDIYENAVSVTRSALSKGTLRGILWHQGEGDSANMDDAKSYGQRFQLMIRYLRSTLSVPGVPVIAGELGTFLPIAHSGLVNQQLRELEEYLPAYACVTSKGLTDKGDRVHFDSKSLREFGIRYAKKYLQFAEIKA